MRARPAHSRQAGRLLMLLLTRCELPLSSCQTAVWLRSVSVCAGLGGEFFGGAALLVTAVFGDHSPLSVKQRVQTIK